MAEPTSMQIYGTPQVVALSTTSAPSAAIGTANSGQPVLTETVRVVSDVAVWLAVAAAPVAVAAAAGNFYLPAGIVEYIDVPAGQKIAGILASGTGNLSLAVARKP